MSASISERAVRSKGPFAQPTWFVGAAVLSLPTVVLLPGVAILLTATLIAAALVLRAIGVRSVALSRMTAVACGCAIPLCVYLAAAAIHQLA